MDCTTYKEEIKSTVTSVRDFSFREKKDPFIDEERVNHFLDAINDFKSLLKEQTGRVYDVNNRMEKLTWYNKLDDECLKMINDLISSAKDLHSSLIRQYISMNGLRKKGIAKSEIKDYKNSVDELKETFQDLESVFFFLPEIPDFVETTKQLSLV